jgi:formate/nitrite transporter
MIPGFDAYAPREIAQRLEEVCLAKSRLALRQLVMLGLLAGAFIGLGALFSVIVLSDATLGFAAQRIGAGAVFSLGLVLVVVAGAELFTGNNLLAMAWADGRLRARDVLKNWLIVGLANFAGAAGLALLVFLSGHAGMNGGAIGATCLKIAAAKTALPLLQAFCRGALCNVLVCLAVWMTLAGRSVTDKFVAILLPITAFVAAGFEHSIANMYFFPLAMLLQAQAGQPAEWGWLWHNLAPVIAGNLFGGSVLVALVYHVIYGRALPATADAPHDSATSSPPRHD